MNNVIHSGIACHTTEKQPIDGRNQFTRCDTCGDWFKPAQVSTVSSLDSRTDLQFLSDSQDTASIRFDFGPQ